jgi:hypothetical protein
MKKRIVVGFSLILVVLFLIACTPLSIPSVSYCEQDRDCVQNKCCHADGAVNKDYTPDCENVLCTQECAPGTLDCGQGEVRCIANECTVVLE